MAESKRQDAGASQVLSEDEQKKRDRMTLIMFGVISLLIIAGMFLLSGFLSGK